MGFLLSIIAALAFAAAADTPTGQLKGTVADITGAAIPYAQVRLLDARSQKVLDEATTDWAGFFWLRDAAPGIYFLDLLAPGFVEHVEAIRVEEGKVVDLGRVRIAITPPCWIECLIVSSSQPVEPLAPRVLTVCEAPTEASSAVTTEVYPVVLVGRLVRSDEGTWLSGGCAASRINVGVAQPSPVALVEARSKRRTAGSFPQDWKRLDFKGEVQSLLDLRTDDPLAKAPLAAVYGWLQHRNLSTVSPISAAAILVYEGPESIYLIDPAR